MPLGFTLRVCLETVRSFLEALLLGFYALLCISPLGLAFRPSRSLPFWSDPTQPNPTRTQTQTQTPQTQPPPPAPPGPTPPYPTPLSVCALCPTSPHPYASIHRPVDQALELALAEDERRQLPVDVSLQVMKSLLGAKNHSRVIAIYRLLRVKCYIGRGGRGNARMTTMATCYGGQAAEVS